MPPRVQDIKTFLSRASTVRDKVQDGAAEWAAWNAFLAAQAAMRAEIRPLEKDIETEHGQQISRSLGGKNKAEAQRKKLAKRNKAWQRRAQELRNGNPRMTDESAAFIIHKEAVTKGQKGCSLRNIQRIIRGQKKV